MTLHGTSDAALRSAAARRGGGTVVLLRCDPGLVAPVGTIGTITTLLAGAVSSSFGDRVAVLHPAGAGAGEERAPPRHRVKAGGVLHVWLDAAAVRAEIERRASAGSQYIFLDASALEPPVAAALEPLVSQVVHLTRDEDCALPSLRAGCDVLRTVVLPAESGGRLSNARVRLRDVARRMALPRRGGRPDGHGSGAPHGTAAKSPPWCRVRLDFPFLERIADPSFAGLPAAEKQSFGRWARALTGRRVGLALGGSGAWGYASAALLLELADRGVPVDLVAGTSSGALVAAYYCAAGVPGLHRLIENGPLFERGVALMALSSAAMEHVVDMDLGRVPLRALEVPFLPVAPHLSRLRPEVIRGGTLGFGVRASGPSPGLFAPTIAPATIIVEGAVTDGVPVALAALGALAAIEAVEAIGADLVIATNPLPAAFGPRSRSAAPGLLGGLRTSSASFGLMLHVAGQHSPGGRRVAYSPEPAGTSLFSTFGFSAAARIVDEVRTRDARFRAAVGASVAAFEELARPRRAALPVASA
jgi:predicted acylesterase/phospholipase RssA